LGEKEGKEDLKRAHSGFGGTAVEGWGKPRRSQPHPRRAVNGL